MNEKDVPLSAREFINKMDFASKIKWYFEQNYDKKSFEAKTKYKEKKYSIEFDNTGKIEDIEIQIQWMDVASSAQTSICAYLKNGLDRYKIKKNQLQYTGKEEDLIRLQDDTKDLVLKYEIIMRIRG